MAQLRSTAQTDYVSLDDVQRPHNPKVGGSNPPLATRKALVDDLRGESARAFFSSVTTPIGILSTTDALTSWRRMDALLLAPPRADVGLSNAGTVESRRRSGAQSGLADAETERSVWATMLDR